MLKVFSASSIEHAGLSYERSSDSETPSLSYTASNSAVLLPGTRKHRFDARAHQNSIAVKAQSTADTQCVPQLNLFSLIRGVLV